MKPFSRVIIDCVGPYQRLNQVTNIFWQVCAATRFPETIALRNIKAATIVTALIKFFTLVGLPKSIQSDQGSNFTSGLFQQVILIGISEKLGLVHKATMGLRRAPPERSSVVSFLFGRPV